MRKIYAIGETVLDIVFKNFQPVTAKPGGSMLNTVVSLGRLNLPVHFITEFGTDTVGDEVDQFLKNNGVNTSGVYRYTHGKSALALAFLDDHNNAHYDFYKIYPSNRLNISFPEIGKDDVVLFGSFFALTREIRKPLMSFIESANKNGALIIYDPNFRKSHLHELNELKPLILENMAMASIVRCSDEDMDLIFNSMDVDEAYDTIKSFCPCLVYTSNSKAVFLRSPLVAASLPVKKIDPVSTIGAGDNFNAGLIYGLLRNNIKKENLETLDIAGWEILMNFGVEFATEVCLTYENYIPLEFAQNYRIE